MHLQYGTMIAFFNYPSKIIHWGSDGSWNSSLAQSPQRFPAQPCPSISSRPARSSPGNCILWNQIQKATCGAPKKPLCICQCPRNTRKWHSALNGKEKISWGVYHKLIGDASSHLVVWGHENQPLLPHQRTRPISKWSHNEVQGNPSHNIHVDTFIL